MRSNGVVHLGNSTFVVALRGVDSALHILTSTLPDPADRVAYLPLDAPTAFHITTTLTPAEERLATHASAAEEEGSRKKEPGIVRSPTREFRGTAAPHRHVLVASEDGRHIAVISTVTTQHYILNLEQIPTAKCALETDEVVRSVCWHPTRPYVLLALLASGRVVIYDVRYYPLGVVLPIARELDVYKYIPLKHYYRRTGPYSKKETIDSKIEPFTTYSALAGADGATVTGTGGAGAADLPDKSARQGSHRLLATASGGDEGAMPKNMFGYRNAAGLYTGATGSSSPAQAGSSRAVKFSEDGADGLPLPIIKEDGEDEVESVDAAPCTPPEALDLSGSQTGGAKANASASTSAVAVVAVQPAAPDASSGALPRTICKEAQQLRGRDLHRLTAPMDPARAGLPPSPPPAAAPLLITPPTAALPEVPELVDTTIVRPTHSLPPTLLLLTALGDVYSCKINHEGLPTTDLSSGVEHRPSAPPPFLTHKICYLVDSGIDETETEAPHDIALAARSCHLDVERELHAVVTVFSNGRAKIAYVSESDLIGQPRDKRVPALAERQVQGIAHYSVSVQLGPPIDAGAYLSTEVPTTTHLVQMSAQDNVCLVRYGSEGAVFALVLPVWLSGRGWCYLVQGEEAARTPALPIVSTDPMVVPTPLSFRLPLATKGKSVTLSAAQVVIVPEEVAPTVATDAKRTLSDAVVIDLRQLVRVAMYGTLGAIARVGHAPLRKPEGTKEKEAPAAAAATATVWDDLDQSLEFAKKAHAAFLERVNQTDAKQQRATQDLLEECTAKVELANGKTKKHWDQLVAKQTRLRVAREELERNVQLLSSQIEVERTTILNGIAHRRGVKGVEDANEKLADIHAILTQVETQLQLPHE